VNGGRICGLIPSPGTYFGVYKIAGDEDIKEIYDGSTMAQAIASAVLYCLVFVAACYQVYALVAIHKIKPFRQSRLVNKIAVIVIVMVYSIGTSRLSRSFDSLLFSDEFLLSPHYLLCYSASPLCPQLRHCDLV